MTSESRRPWVLPIFLVACLLLGGSRQGIWGNMLLQLGGVALFVWAYLGRPSDPLTPAARYALALAGAAGLVIALQLMPLPPSVWSALPGRELVTAGFDRLGYPLPYLPLSLAPYEALPALLTILPAIGVLVAVLRDWQRESYIAAALLMAMFLGVLLGALQVAGGGPLRSPWYLYSFTNSGAVGFFANVNHMGSLLLVSIPFSIALFAGMAARKRERSLRHGVLLLGIAALVVTILGIALNRSLAALILAPPVVIFSLLLLPISSGLRRLTLLAATIAMVGGVFFLATASLSEGGPGDSLRSFSVRTEIWAATIDLIRQSFPVGTGLGSFELVYPLTEDAAQIRSTSVNHAHNDYLEVVLELGLAGALLIAAFLAWWVVQVVKVWCSPFSTLYIRAATIASGTLLAHSIVDYPLRTAAVSAVFAVCIGLMAQPRRQQQSSGDRQARPTKHVAIG